MAIMLLLAADTSNQNGSIALARVGSGPGDVEVLEVVPLVGGTFSGQLVPQIAGLLRRLGFSKQEISAFAVVSGPGSFTGLRVGLAAIKALGEILAKPIAAVSRLETVAISGSVAGKVVAALDAGRKQVYAGVYEVGPGANLCLGEELLELEDFLSKASEGTVVTPHGLLVDVLRARQIPCQQVAEPRSDIVARLGWRKIMAGETVSVEDLEANYLRRSDAEISIRRDVVS